MNTIGTAIALLATHWRRLLAVLLPVLVPILVADHLISGHSLTERRDADDIGLYSLLLFMLGWCVAIPAAVAVAAGALRGRPVRPAAALRLGVGSVPVALLSIALTAGAVWLGLVAVVAPGDQLLGAGPSLIVVVPALCLIAVVVSRILLLVPQGVLGGGPVAVLGWARLPAAAAVFIGVVLAPFTLGWLAEVARDGLLAAYLPPAPADLVPAVAAAIVADVALVAVFALQAAALTAVYLQRHPGSAPVADLAAVDGHLDALRDGTAARPSRTVRSVALAALLAAPALVGGVLVVAQPAVGTPPRVHELDTFGEIEQVFWPAGGHPVIVTDHSVQWCLDDDCAQTREHLREVQGGWGTAAGVGTDGTVVLAGLGGRDVDELVVTDGDDAVRLERCVEPGACEQGITRWHTGGARRGDAEEQQSHLAAAAAADGSILVATARPVLVEPGQAPRVELALTRCNTVDCTSRRFMPLGTASADLTAPSRDLPGNWSPRWYTKQPPLVTVRLDARDVPTVFFRDPASDRTWIAACDTAACAKPTLTDVYAGTRTDQVAFTPGPRPQAVVLGHGMVDFRTGDPDESHVVRLADDPGDPYEGVIEVTPTGVYALLLEPAPEPEGVRLVLDDQPQERLRLSLWHCPDLRCDAPRKTPLRKLDGQLGAVALAVAEDGRALVTARDRSAQLVMVITP